MIDKLEKLNIKESEHLKLQIENFMKYFLDYNQKVNLISSNDEKVLFEKHIFDSLAFNLFVQKYDLNPKSKIMDIGTGGGFPALPISILYKNFNVCAVDSINKKINFIKNAKQDLDIQNIKPICSRIEELPENMKNSFDVVTTRAMAELRMILEYAIPFVKQGGYFVAYKSIKAQEEIDNAKNALKILNTRLVDTIEYTLPIDEENKRVLLIFKKEKNIPSSYPRSNGLVKKKPL